MPKAMLNTQKSAEVIVAERQRTESVGVSSMTEKGDQLWQKTLKMMAVRKEIMRNMKGMQKRVGHSI